RLGIESSSKERVAAAVIGVTYSAVIGEVLLSFPKIRVSGRIGIFHSITCRNCETLGEVRRKRLDPRGIFASAETTPDQDSRINCGGNDDSYCRQQNYLPGLHFIYLQFSRANWRTLQSSTGTIELIIHERRSSVPPDATVEQVGRLKNDCEVKP